MVGGISDVVKHQLLEKSIKRHGTKMDEIGTILDEIASEITNTFNPEKIIVFSSYAYGGPTEKSTSTFA